MAEDPLHTPLRRHSWRERLRLRGKPSVVAFALVLLGLAGLFAWAWMQPAPAPQPVVAERPLPPRPAEPVAPAREEADDTVPEVADDMPGAATGRHDGDSGRPKVATRTAGGARILDVSKLPEEEGGASAGGSGSGGQVVIEMASDLQPLPKAPMRGLVEKSAHGPLPKVGRNGRKPWQAYARPVPRAVLFSSRPKLAVLVVDLGLKAGLTDVALRRLPGEVSMAFAPRGKGLRRLGAQARRLGHEFFLQVPMEPWGYPAVNPGPLTLRSDDVAGNRERLLRLLGKAVGYVGVVSYAGQKFLQQGEALVPVMHVLKRRGLLVVDDGTAAQSMMPELGLVVGVPVLRADVRVPPGLKPAQARALMEQALEQAREGGRALLVVSADAVNLEQLRQWLGGLAMRDTVALVPVSALARLPAGAGR